MGYDVDRRLTPLQRRALAFVARDGAATPLRMSDDFGDRPRVRALLARLKRKGLVIYEGFDSYEITAKGRAALGDAPTLRGTT